MIIDQLPNISCIVLDYKPDLVEAFKADNYPNKEMVVCSKEFIANVQGTFFQCSEHLTLNEMRDAAIEVSRGELTCWWYHPTVDLMQEYQKFLRNESKRIISKQAFYEAGSMLYTRGKCQSI